MTTSGWLSALGAARAVARLSAHAATAQGHASDADGSFASEMHRSMKDMMRGMEVPMTGDSDRDFLAMMIPHHRGAVEMAHLALVHGRDPLTRQLAEEIISSQRAETASMRARLCVPASREALTVAPVLSV